MKVLNLTTFSTDEGREQFKTLIDPLVQRAYDDAAFKAELISNPAAVIQRETGVSVDLPDRWHFSVIDRSDPFALYIDLPVNEDSYGEELELTDEELELVAGGKKGINIFGGCGSKNENCKGANCVAGCGGGGEEE